MNSFKTLNFIIKLTAMIAMLIGIFTQNISVILVNGFLFVGAIINDSN